MKELECVAVSARDSHFVPSRSRRDGVVRIHVEENARRAAAMGGR
jgi:hypothetical protein